MAPRPGGARPRDIDFSAVGKAGRYARVNKDCGDLLTSSQTNWDYTASTEARRTWPGRSFKSLLVPAQIIATEKCH